MTLSRRKFIALLGGGTVFAATAGTGTFLATRTPQAALAPWAAAGGRADPRLNALSHAILAPNPHNLQPWLAELHGPDGVRLWRDTARALPATDPFDRQLTIGMGCFLETFVLAAGTDGHGCDIALFPDAPAPRPGLVPVADIRLLPGAATPDPLAAHIGARRSAKVPFLPDMPDAAQLDALSAHARVIVDPALVADLRAVTWDAWQIEANTLRTHHESVDLMRFGKREIEAAPDGIDLGGPFLESLMAVGLLTRDAQKDPGSMAFRTGVGMYREMLAATPAHAVIVTDGNTAADQIAAGRAWMRLNLAATAQGFALHPISQCLQEFPEMAEPFERAHALLAGPGQRVQMLGRLGIAPDVLPPTPRWPLETRLIGA
jgi:hypothetical protein